MKRGAWVGAGVALCSLLLGLTVFSGSLISAVSEDGKRPAAADTVAKQPRPVPFSAEDLRGLLAQVKPANVAFAPVHQVETPEGRFTLETSIDSDLQRFVVDLLHRSMTQHSAAVVIRPDTGQVLAMASYENNGNGGGGENLCLRADFPAASLFKIVAAAAAVEARGMNPETPLAFRGQKYTLYKSQLKEDKAKKGKKQNPGTKTTLREAFSDSINPVFGKIAIHYLGSDLISEYADRFLFNHSIPFELFVAPSRYVRPMDDYALAEVASGFNKRTLISPLHAGLITASVANGGTMMAPWLVRSVRSHAGDLLYEASPSVLANPISRKTANKMMALMEGTVVEGTCRKAFQPLQHKRELRYVDLGAKTGTINGATDHYKYEWLTAYALPSDGDGGLCITVMTAHGERIGVRAKDIARLIIDRHYRS
ncbi:MAG: penicillin-binding transpeptidase domain-containing protein [Deltaproteobacteria bacterium]